MKTAAIFAAAALILILLVTEAYAAECKGVIIVNKTEKRYTPSKNGRVLTTLRKNDQIVIGEVKKDNEQRLWYRVVNQYVEAADVNIIHENGSSWCKFGPATTPRPLTPQEQERQGQQAVAALRWFSGLWSNFARPQRY